MAVCDLTANLTNLTTKIRTGEVRLSSGEVCGEVCNDDIFRILMQIHRNYSDYWEKYGQKINRTKNLTTSPQVIARY
jgi:hypothetical protein